MGDASADLEEVVQPDCRVSAAAARRCLPAQELFLISGPQAVRVGSCIVGTPADKKGEDVSVCLTIQSEVSVDKRSLNMGCGARLRSTLRLMVGPWPHGAMPARQHHQVM